MKKWVKILLPLLGVAALSVGIYFTLKALGVTSVEGIRELVASCGAWGWIVFIALFIVCSTLLCFIPGTSATFIAVSIVMFGALKGFIISTIAVFLASSLMFLIGNTLGEKAAVKIVGKESLEKAQNLLDVKSKMLLPLMFLFPVFPDDALCMVAGMTKMRYWYFAVVAAIFRTVGIATICFLGSGFINWAELKITDWFVLINVCIFDIFLIFKYQNKIEKFILRKREPSANDIDEIYSARVNNLLLQLEGLDEALAKNHRTIDEKKYCSEKQLTDIQNKIKKIEIQKAKIENNLKAISNKGDETKVDSARVQMQNLVCKQLKTIMKNNFPDTKYEITLSKTTASVYMTLIATSGVKKVIRFSDHYSNKVGSKYNFEASLSTKTMKVIIEKNLKILNRKTVFVLLNKIEEERGKNGEKK